MPPEGLCPLFYFDWLVVANRPVKLVLANPADKQKPRGAAQNYLYSNWILDESR